MEECVRKVTNVWEACEQVEQVGVRLQNARRGYPSHANALKEFVHQRVRCYIPMHPDAFLQETVFLHTGSVS